MVYKKPSQKGSERLDDFLVLNTFMNKLFGMESFKDFQILLKNVDDGFDDEGRSHVFNTLHSQKNIDPRLKSKLEEYDSNIKSYVDHISNRQEHRIRLKYFQYLAALFTEIYLDRYFEDPIKLMNELTPGHVERLSLKEKNEDFKPIYIKNDLEKLAYWMATGSGKTFLLHINYLQFMRYNKGKHKLKLDNILLITPNESLSNQHLEEMRKSGILCELFQSQNLGPLSQYADHNVVKIIDIHKLTEEKKGQGVSVDIENFGRKNLIFVDEGHKGSGGQKWKYFREELAKEGFNFEYSATFGQAVAASSGKEKNDLLNKYGKSIIFDYSYRYFHDDGYGKEYSIMNLKEKYSDSIRHTLMLANLLTLYEQKLIFKKHTAEIEPYNIEEPLWIFVGSKVQGKQNQSDILEVVRFLDLVLKNEENWAIQGIENIFAGNSGLKDKTTGWDLFSPTYPEQKLGYIRGSEPVDIYKDMLKRIFHSDNPGPLHLINLRNAAGEIALRCGISEFFGVINIGDDAQFIKHVETETKIHIVKDEVSSGSLFDTINKQNSKVNVLIGAKKFIEGWNSPRVSNMGLLNIGKSEGTQIIQLFGRGVRLKGKNNSLKRSRAEDYPPAYLHILERLNIFGIQANYMDQFEEYLKNEGVQTENNVEIAIPIQINESFLKEGLLYPYVDKKRFKKEEFYELKYDPIIDVDIDLLPKIEMIESQKPVLIGTQSDTKTKKIDYKYLDLLDWSRIYFSLLEFRILKSWNNIIFSKKTLRDIIEKDVYSLKCLESDIKPSKFEDIENIEEIVVSIMKKYMQGFYNRMKNIWTKQNLDVRQLDKSNGNFEFKEFRVSVKEKDSALIEEIRSKKSINFERHLFQPLFVKDEKSSTYKSIPDGLNPGERQFIEDLKQYILEKHTEYENKNIFVLRNLPKIGIGFFIDTLYYYPDFIIWIKTNNMQQVIFADPKGLGHIKYGFKDEKIQLYNHLKEREAILTNKLSDRGENIKINLNSYVISVTDIDLHSIFSTNQLSALMQNHVLIQKDKKYIGKMLGESDLA